MCDCQYCREVESLSMQINKLQIALNGVNDLSFQYNTVHMALQNMRGMFSEYMSCDTLTDTEDNLMYLDSDLIDAKTSVTSIIGNKIDGLVSERSNVQSKANQHHYEMEQAELERKRQLAANGNSDNQVKCYSR